MPAMPLITGAEKSTYNGVEFTKSFIDSYGLTKREMFAMHAMQGYLSQLDWGGCQGGGVSVTHEEAAREVVCYADALFKELEK